MGVCKKREREERCGSLQNAASFEADRKRGALLECERERSASLEASERRKGSEDELGISANRELAAERGRTRRCASWVWNSVGRGTGGDDAGELVKHPPQVFQNGTMKSRCRSAHGARLRPFRRLLG